jgi:hypothetical protein
MELDRSVALPAARAAPDGEIRLPMVSVLVDGRAVAVLHTYPLSRDVQLHSLAELVEFQCAVCDRRQESAMLATRGHDLVCPSCFAGLSLDPPRHELPPVEPRLTEGSEGPLHSPEDREGGLHDTQLVQP